MKRITILMGISGSGKSTWTAKNRPGAQVCSADHYFVVDGVYRFNPTNLGEAHNACVRKFTELLQSGCEDIVVDNTNTNLIDLAPYIALGNAYGYFLVVVCLKIDHKIAAARNTHGVSEATVKTMEMNINRTLASWPSFWPRPAILNTSNENR